MMWPPTGFVINSEPSISIPLFLLKESVIVSVSNNLGTDGDCKTIPIFFKYSSSDNWFTKLFLTSLNASLADLEEPALTSVPNLVMFPPSNWVSLYHFVKLSINN